MLLILVYSMIDDGWRNVDWSTAAMAVLSGNIFVCLFIPVVRKLYWRRPGMQADPLSSRAE